MPWWAWLLLGAISGALAAAFFIFASSIISLAKRDEYQ